MGSSPINKAIYLGDWMSWFSQWSAKPCTPVRIRYLPQISFNLLTKKSYYNINKYFNMALTIEQKVLKLLAELRLMNDVTLIGPAMLDPEVAERIINLYGDFIPDFDEDGDCDHVALTNDEIQEVFDNDEDQINKGDA